MRTGITRYPILTQQAQCPALSGWQDAQITQGAGARRRVPKSSQWTVRTVRSPPPISQEDTAMTACTGRRPAALTRLTAVAAVAVAGALVLTGCGDQTKD